MAETNRSQLARAYAMKKGITIKEAGERIKDVCDLVVNELEKGNNVSIFNFLSFEIRERKGFEGSHPATQEKITVKPKKFIHVKQSKRFKDSVQ